MLRGTDGTCQARFTFELQAVDMPTDSIEAFVGAANSICQGITEGRYVNQLGSRFEIVDPHFQYRCGIVVSVRTKHVMAASLGSGVVLKIHHRNSTAMSYDTNLPAMSYETSLPAIGYDMVFLSAGHYSNEFHSLGMGAIYDKLVSLGLSPFSLIEPWRLKEDLNGVLAEADAFAIRSAAELIIPTPRMLCQARSPEHLIEHLVINAEQKEILKRRLNNLCSPTDASCYDFATNIALNRLELLMEVYAERHHLLSGHH